MIAGATGGIGVDLAGGGSVTNGRSQRADRELRGRGLDRWRRRDTDQRRHGQIYRRWVFYGVVLSAAGSNVLNNGATGYIGSQSAKA